MNITVPLERIDSALLTSFNSVSDVTYDGGYYSTFNVSQRGSQAIVGSSSETSVAFFAFKVPNEYIGFHSGLNFHIKNNGNNQFNDNGKIIACFENPSLYLDAGCDHINKKISWGSEYGTYVRGLSDIIFYPGTTSAKCYDQYFNTWYMNGGNLLDLCGAKYIIFVKYNTNITIDIDMSIDIETDLPCANVDIVYPDNVSIKKNISHLFSWTAKGSEFNCEYRNEIIDIASGVFDLKRKEIFYTFFPGTVHNSRDSIITKSAIPCPTYLKSHTLYYRKKGTSQYTQISETNDHNYVEIPADTFDIDTYEYYVAQTLENGYTIYTSLAEFYTIGQDSAPTISGVTNNSIPTVSWTDSNQAAFEIRIKDAEQNIVYTSGLIVDNNQSYQITKMLPNGTYIVEVRELNIYGIYSDWGSAQFVLNPSSVSAPTDIFVSVNNKFGVEISGTPVGSAQKTYVVRRVAGTDNIEIVGIYTGEIFTDYTAKGNTYYEYSLRNYNVAYADGAFIPVEVKVKEAIIQDGRDVTNFLDLSWSEDVTFNIEYTDEADRTLYNCLGRRYPVKEMGEWVNSVRSFVAYVRAEDINRLNDMNLNAPKVYFKGNHEYYACDMSIEDQGAYVGGGRMIRFTLTRIADDEGIII